MNQHELQSGVLLCSCSRNVADTLRRFVFIPLFMLGQRSPEACVLWGHPAAEGTRRPESLEDRGCCARSQRLLSKLLAELDVELEHLKTSVRLRIRYWPSVPLRTFCHQQRLASVLAGSGEHRREEIPVVVSSIQANLAMMYGPDCCSTQEKREVAGKASHTLAISSEPTSPVHFACNMPLSSMEFGPGMAMSATMVTGAPEGSSQVFLPWSMPGKPSRS